MTPSQLRTATTRIKRHLADVESQMYGPHAHRYFSDVIDADDPRAAFHKLSLDQKRTLTAACEESLRALEDALAKRGVTGTRKS